MSDDYDPRDHYWIVAGDVTRLWSSQAQAFVLANDKTYAAWRAAGGRPSRVANLFELDQALRAYGLSTGDTFTAEDALDALAAIDAGRVRQALGRTDLSAGSLVAGDADKLRALAGEMQPTRRDGGSAPPPAIDGATKAVTPDERLAKLEAGAAASLTN